MVEVLRVYGMELDQGEGGVDQSNGWVTVAADRTWDMIVLE